MLDSDMVFIRHPDLGEDVAPAEVTVGAFRDSWSTLGWKLADENKQEGPRVGKTTEADDALAELAQFREKNTTVVQGTGETGSESGSVAVDTAARGHRGGGS